MKLLRTCLIAGLSLPLASAAFADQPAYLVTADSVVARPAVTHHAVNGRNATSTAVIVQRRVAQPAAVVSRSLAEQPVHPYLIEVRLANTTTVYLDPDRDYQYQNGNPIDTNHTLLQAQRLGRELNNPGVTIVRNERAADETQSMVRADEIQPRAILQAPPRPRKDHQPQNAPESQPKRWKVAAAH